jgi:hypothetical protein
LAKALDPETWGDRPPAASGANLSVTFYLPQKAQPGDSARVIEGSAKLEDGTDEPAD